MLLALAVFLAIQARRPVESQTQTGTQTRTGTRTDEPTPPAAPIVKRDLPTPPPPKAPDAAPQPPPRETLVKGELPFPPPLFDDGRDRDRFKRWWITEVVRRADVYRRLEPGRQYPTDQETEQMVGRLYDLAEPMPQNADQVSAGTQYADRQQQYFQLANKDFVKAFGAPATEIIHRGGDPKFGAAPDPPVLPPGWKGP